MASENTTPWTYCGAGLAGGFLLVVRATTSTPTRNGMFDQLRAVAAASLSRSNILRRYQPVVGERPAEKSDQRYRLKREQFATVIQLPPVQHLVPAQKAGPWLCHWVALHQRRKKRDPVMALGVLFDPACNFWAVLMNIEQRLTCVVPPYPFGCCQHERNACQIAACSVEFESLADNIGTRRIVVGALSTWRLQVALART